MGKPRIRQARMSDVDSILSTYSALHEYEKLHGVNTNWAPGIYPVPEIPRKKTKAGAMYVLEDPDISASMALDSVCSPEYDRIKWPIQACPEKVLTIHAFVVTPQKFGKGYGKMMLDFAKQFAATNGFETIRIDTWIHNEPAKSLYLKNGFEIAGYGPISIYELRQEEVFLEYALDRNCRQ